MGTMAKKGRSRSRAQQGRPRPTATPNGSKVSNAQSTGTKATGSKAAGAKTTGAANRARKIAPPPPSRGAAIRSGLGRPLTIGVIAIVLFGGFYGWQWLQARKAPAPLTFVPATVDVSQDPNLAGLQTGPPPWDSALGTLRARLAQLHLPYLGQEIVQQHFHVHLDVLVNGRPVAVPDDVGRNEGEGKLTVIHTHDGSGIIHIEAPTGPHYTLGQVFDVWGVKFTPDCLGGLCNDATRRLRVFADGQLLRDPRRLILASHQEIVVTFGTSAQVPDPVPSRYHFPVGA